MTLFEKICARQIPADIVYEDDLVMAIRDISPKAPIHILVFPKKPLARIAEAGRDDEQVLGHLLVQAAEVAAKLGLAKTGYRLVINNGPDAGESVPHLHCHILGGRAMAWPPGVNAPSPEGSSKRRRVGRWPLIYPSLIRPCSIVSS